MKIISSILLVLAAHMMSAQDLSPEVVATAGETFSSNSLTLDWTLGEIMTESYSGTIVLTQGFHQPDNNTTSLEDLASLFGTIKVYPNPTTDLIVIETEQAGGLDLLLYDMTGRTVLHKNVSASSSQLNLSGLPDGTYLLRLSDGQQAIRSLRIHKQ